MKRARDPARGKWAWIYLSMTSNSGKSLYACNRCGLVTPGPTKWKYHREVCMRRRTEWPYAVQNSRCRGERRGR